MSTRSSACMPDLLRLEGVTRRFGGVAALDDCSLSLQAGHVTGLIVANGAGKTTLLLARPRQRGENVLGALVARSAIHAEECVAAAEARRLLERVGLWHMADRLAGDLSGGQKKLLELARALMLAPKLILLDEPVAGVAPPLVDKLIGLIRDLVGESITFAIVEHDMHVVSALCDHVHVLAEGRPLVSGRFGEVTSDPRVVAAYLGQPA